MTVLAQINATIASQAKRTASPPIQTAPVFGVDISNYSGTPSQATLACWRDAGVKHVCVRLSTESESMRAIAIQQLRAVRDAGLTCSGYVWDYWNLNASDHVNAALLVARDAGVPLTVVWIDCESTPGLSKLGVLTWIDAAQLAIKAQSGRPGIYTRANWWQQNTGDSLAFSQLPLWEAHYDSDADLNAWRPFGGWDHLSAKQYVGDTQLCGVTVDLDTFGAAVV